MILLSEISKTRLLAQFVPLLLHSPSESESVLTEVPDDAANIPPEEVLDQVRGPSPCHQQHPHHPTPTVTVARQLEGQGLQNTGEERAKEGGNTKGAWRRTVLSGNFFFHLYRITNVVSEQLYLQFSFSSTFSVIK